MSYPRPKIYNSLSNEIEEVTAEGPIGLYVCGVTPYDTAHLGHAFTYTSFDVLVRFLRFRGNQVTYVQNVTDIDDDILKRARETNLDWQELGDRETAKFVRDMTAINNLAPDVMPRATQHMAEIIEIAARLIDQGTAYESNGSVYFNVPAYKRFGSLNRSPYADQLALANQHGNFPDDPNKRDPLDFVLWQVAKPGEPTWSSPWGEGRPGWHIECSAMSMKYLGETVTIHGGGQDLAFPHHDCEIAQSECFTGKPFVRYWMHTGLVALGPTKMSKSIGNMVFVSDLLIRHPGDAVRLLLLQHHYRSSWPYDDEAMDATAELQAELTAKLAGQGEASVADVEEWGDPFLAAMAADLDTPLAVRELTTLAETDSPGARRTARRLGQDVLGLRLEG